MIKLDGSNVMLDLETMGTRPNAPIIAIGAVVFDTNGIRRSFYENINLSIEVANGAVIDPDTVMWWMAQSDDARHALTNGNAMTPSIALTNFADWLPKDAKVWGNGVDFDNVLLTECYRRHSLHQPWKFYNNRCYRTVKNLVPSIVLERVGTFHNALDDAMSQAYHLIDILKATQGTIDAN